MKSIVIATLLIVFAALPAVSADINTALSQIEDKLRSEAFNDAELKELKATLGNLLKGAKDVDVDAVVSAAKSGKAYGLKVSEIAKVSAAASKASEESTAQTRVQTKAMIDELLKEKCDAKGIEKALDAVKDAISNGYSPRESRAMVSVAVLEGLKDGLRGKELAEKIDEVRAAFKEKERAKHGIERGEVQKMQKQERRQQQIRSGQTGAIPPVEKGGDQPHRPR